MITATLATAGGIVLLRSRLRNRSRKEFSLKSVLQTDNPRISHNEISAQSMLIANQKSSDLDRNLGISLIVMGVTTVGRVGVPWFNLLSLPGLLYLNVPFIGRGIREIRQESRVGIGVLDSVASTGMLLLGNFFADALFLTLYFTSRKLLAQTQNSASLGSLNNQIMAERADATPEEAAEEEGYLPGVTLAHHKLRSETLIDQAAVGMLAISGITLLLRGGTAAVAVLVGYFGYDLRLIAPLSVRNYQRLAAEKGILVRDGRHLELLREIDTVIIGETVLSDLDDHQTGQAAALARIQAKIPNLIRLGIDPLPTPDQIATWRQEGRRICFVGEPELQSEIAQQVEIVVSANDSLDAAILLKGKAKLSQTADLLDLAEAMHGNVRNSILITAIPNLISLTGIYFFKFGVIPAILLDQAGLVLGTTNAMRPLYSGSFSGKRHQQAAVHPNRTLTPYSDLSGASS